MAVETQATDKVTLTSHFFMMVYCHAPQHQCASCELTPEDLRLGTTLLAAIPSIQAISECLPRGSLLLGNEGYDSPHM